MWSQGRSWRRCWALWFAALAWSSGFGCKPGSPANPDGSVDSSVPIDSGPVSMYPATLNPFTLKGAVADINDPVYDDWMPHLRDDGLELFFASNRPEAANDTVLDWNIWVSTRATPTSAWTAPTPVTALNGPDYDWNPVLSDDGLTIYFGRGLGEVWSATRSSIHVQIWTSIARVDALNTLGYDTRPSDVRRLPDGSETLTLLSNRPGGLGTAGSDYDLWIATRANAQSAWTIAHGGAALNSTAWDTEATITADTLSMYLQSKREGGVYRLFEATRASTADPFAVTSIALEFLPTDGTTQLTQPHFSADAKTLYFGHRVAGGSWDIHYATR